MKCSICGFDDSIYFNDRTIMLSGIEKALSTKKKEYNSKINELYRINGLSDEMLERIDGIDDHLKNIDIDIIENNKDYHVKIEPLLRYIIGYYKNYIETTEPNSIGSIKSLMSNSSIRQKGSNKKYTVIEIINKMKTTKIPLNKHLDLKELGNCIEKLEKAKMEIEEKNIIFFKKEFNIGSFGFSYDTNNIIKDISINNNILIANTYSLNICPYCCSMLKEVANAAFSVKEKERMINEG